MSNKPEQLAFQFPEQDRTNAPKFCQRQPVNIAPHPLPYLPDDPTDEDVDRWLRDIAEDDRRESGIREHKVSHE